MMKTSVFCMALRKPPPPVFSTYSARLVDQVRGTDREMTVGQGFLWSVPRTCIVTFSYRAKYKEDNSKD